MGIDAQLFIRRTGPALSRDAVAALSDRAEAELGRDLFLSADDALFGFGPGALFICPTVTAFAAACETLGASPRSEFPELQGKFAGASVWMEDARLIIGMPGEQFIGSYLNERYFTCDYPAGDWRRISAIVDWLQINIPDGEVWYGGDSSGIQFEPLTPAIRSRFSACFAERAAAPPRTKS
jgi:hypothetical protein